MYTHTHTRIRNYVRVGANLPPPESNRVKYRLFCILMTTVVQLKLTSVQYGLMSCQPINCISSKICKLGEALD